MERVSWQPLALLLLAAAAAVASGTEVGYDGRSMVIDGERRLLISGSIHYPRSTPEVCIAHGAADEYTIVSS